MTKVYDCFRVKKKGHIGIGTGWGATFLQIFFSKDLTIRHIAPPPHPYELGFS